MRTSALVPPQPGQEIVAGADSFWFDFSASRPVRLWEPFQVIDGPPNVRPRRAIGIEGGIHALAAVHEIGRMPTQLTTFPSLFDSWMLRRRGPGNGRCLPGVGPPAGSLLRLGLGRAGALVAHDGGRPDHSIRPPRSSPQRPLASTSPGPKGTRSRPACARIAAATATTETPSLAKGAARSTSPTLTLSRWAKTRGPIGRL